MSDVTTVAAESLLSNLVDGETRALEDQKGSDNTPTMIESGVVSLVTEKFNRASDARRVNEQKWLTAYRNYRGEYAQDVLSRIEPGDSKAFVKITKTKVIAAHGQVLDILFGAGKFPIEITNTPIPFGAEETETLINSQVPEDVVAKVRNIYMNGAMQELPPGARRTDLLNAPQEEPQEETTGPFRKSKGPSPDRTQFPELHPAELAARRMNRVIFDQLAEANIEREVRRAVFECALLGTGVVKGPFTKDKRVANWELEGDELVYAPQTKTCPSYEQISIWNSYPDPDARSSKDMEWFIERHALGLSSMRDLMERPFFRKNVIDHLIRLGPAYTNQWFEDQLVDSEILHNANRWEVLEYWGTVSEQDALASGLDFDEDDLDDTGNVHINAWVCNGEVLRLVVNPFIPIRIPYNIVPYEEHPYQIWGIGVAENMQDSQEIMNGHMRMAIDNLKLAGNMVFDVDETSLVPGQSMDIYAGKIFRRHAGAPGQAIVGIKFPNTANENLQMFDKARQLSDEQTGIPSFSHGITGVMSPTRTASGMSMLMGAGTVNIKTVIANMDDYLIGPIGESLFAWNMQFNDTDASIRGDLNVKARGTSALLQREVLSQRLVTFMQVAAQNPSIAPMVNWEEVLKIYAESLDLDSDRLVNDPQKAGVFAALFQQVQQGMQAGGGQQVPGGQAGAGDMAPQVPTAPGQPEFSGNPQASPQLAGAGAMPGAMPNG